MTGPGASGASRLRIAGVALLGVAAIAAVVGLISLGGQGSSAAPAGSPTAAGPAPSSQLAPAPAPPAAPPNAAAPAPGQAGLPGAALPGAPTPGAAPPVVGALPPVAAAPPIVPGGGGPGGASSGGGGTGGSGGGAASYAAVPVRVYNNSMIVGLAEKARDQMKARGFDVVETGNYAQGNIPVSTAYYRPGTDEQGAADAVAAAFGLRSQPRFPGIENASPGVIVIATNNWGQTAQKGS